MDSWRWLLVLILLSCVAFGLILTLMVRYWGSCGILRVWVVRRVRVMGMGYRLRLEYWVVDNFWPRTYLLVPIRVSLLLLTWTDNRRLLYRRFSFVGWMCGSSRVAGADFGIV